MSTLVHNNCDVKYIQEWVGHADIATTLKIYARVKQKEAKHEVAEKMNTIIPLDFSFVEDDKNDND